VHRASLEKTREVLSCFVNLSLKTTSKFLEEKVGDAPSVNHAAEIAEFNSAKKAVDRDLGRLLSSIPTQEAGVVFSVHYSDINGLSRLENNILAHEISEYLGKTH
jgi:dihydroxyacetone kinase